MFVLGVSGCEERESESDFFDTPLAAAAAPLPSVDTSQRFAATKQGPLRLMRSLDQLWGEPHRVDKLEKKTVSSIYRQRCPALEYSRAPSSSAVAATAA